MSKSWIGAIGLILHCTLSACAQTTAQDSAQNQNADI
jgi:hypothetical protein